MTKRAGPNGQTWTAAVCLVPAAFLSAFLIFQVQPMIGKYILPWFGGAPAVWTTCLLFFQTLLLAGYAYAHLSVSRLRAQWQAPIHVLLLLVALTASILPESAWKPQGDEYPLLRITLMLVSSVGLPFLALSASGPLLQAWYTRLRPGRTPYRLYAVSNAGSLLALLSYPFLVEPRFSVTEQARIWSWVFVAFIVLCGSIAWFVWRASSGKPAQSEGTGRAVTEARKAVRAEKPPALLHRWLWVAWSACSVVLFMAVTNYLTIDIAAVPLLWILPLSIYLVSFILTFSSTRWYNRRLFSVLFVGALVVFVLTLPTGLAGRNILLKTDAVQMIILSGVALFICCMVCHGELYRLRPDPSHLTRYYLSIALGGAAGGAFVAVLAPHVFLMLQELQLGLLLCCILYLATALNDPAGALRLARYRWARAAAVIGVVVMAAWPWVLTTGLLRDAVYVERDFFGLLRVKEKGRNDPTSTHRFELYHGTIVHGLQLVGPELKKLPTAYYGPTTGIGVLLSTYSPSARRRVGAVGMGAGTISAYGRRGDLFVYYELNPSVVDVAQTYFSFLEDSESEYRVRLGDARLNLEREPDQAFDILVLDAFSSDSVPVHLLTVEAMEVYGRHLRPDGIIALNALNNYLDLIPLAFNLADASGFHALGIINKKHRGDPSADSIWIMMSRNASALEELRERTAPLRSAGIVRLMRQNPEASAGVGVWTDDSSSLFELMR